MKKGICQRVLGFATETRTNPLPHAEMELEGLNFLISELPYSNFKTFFFFVLGGVGWGRNFHPLNFALL
jgi:hypothetical protein